MTRPKGSIRNDLLTCSMLVVTWPALAVRHEKRGETWATTEPTGAASGSRLAMGSQPEKAPQPCGRTHD